MNIKKQQASLSSIRLSEILGDQEFKQLLGQKADTIDFTQNFLIDLQKDISIFGPQINKNNPKSYDSQAAIKQKKLMEQAYERAKRPGKLLSNPIFRFEQTKQNDSNQAQHDSDEQGDYFGQYMKWKQDTSTTKKNERKIKQTKNHKDQLIHKILEGRQKDGLKVSKKQSSSDSDELNAEIKKIQQEYLAKITQVTNKNIFPQKAQIPIIQPKQKESQSQSKIEINACETKQPQLSTKLNTGRKVVNEEKESKSHRFENQDINQYCFENMIKRKPDFVNFKRAKRQNSSKENSQIQKEQIRRDIEKIYQIEPDKTSKSGLQNSNISPVDSQSRVSQKNESGTLDPQLDPYYTELKQMIKNGYNLQNLPSNKQIDTKQIPTKQTAKTSPIVKLNVQKLLCLPYKEFLLFFGQNHRKILSMTQPEQYKRLQTYQIKCLEHAESIHKLRQRFSSQQGARIIQHLSLQQKQKLFKVLYQNQA